MVPSLVGVGIVGASIAASVGAGYLLRYLYRKRGRSGAGWFMGNIAAVALFCLSYGIALLVFDPAVRVALEAVALACVCFMGPFFLAFGLDYTGRGDLVRTPLFGLVAAVPVVSAALAVTNPVHGLVWTDFAFDPIFGLATATYTLQPWGLFALAFSIATAAVGSLLLIGAILSYGPLYRREATAVILSTVPPSVGVALWMAGVGPLSELHLTAPLMVGHVALDGFAFVGTHMSETNPATQRMAERTGLDSLAEPVFVLDTDGRIVRVNDRADALFAPDSLPVPLEAVTGMSVATLRETGEVTVDADGGGTFAVSYSPLTDPDGDAVGSMVVLYDVTEERQRGQQLAVLNRVLRHNLRNETTVISGFAEVLQGSVDDPTQVTHAGKIVAASDRLNSIATKVRNFEPVQGRAYQPESVAVGDLVADIAGRYADTHDAATIEWAVEPSDLRLRTDPVILSVLLEHLVENAVVHADAAAPTVRIAAAAAGSDVRISIRDENDRIPAIEIETLRAGEETPLKHGQGIGLWIAYWCVQRLHGDIDFDYDDGNVVTVRL